MTSGKQAFISSDMQNLWFSANNCAPGCGCKDDRFEMTSGRVAEWKSSVAREAYASVLQDLITLSAPESTDEVLEGVRISTNIYFEDEAEARRWMRAWVPLLDGTAPTVDANAREVWLEQTKIQFQKSAGAPSELREVSIEAPGELFGSSDGRLWTKLAPTPQTLKLSIDLALRFFAAPTLYVEELSCFDSRPLVDLRLYECHGVSDEALRQISNLTSLEVLSLESLQLRGETLGELARLPQLKRLDLSGCTSIPEAALLQLKKAAPSLQIRRDAELF